MADASSAGKTALKAAGSDAPAVLPSGVQIYDALMSQIEPELLSINATMLAEQYKNETPAERKARMARYKAAFQKYDAAYAAWASEFHHAVTAHRSEAFQAAEEKMMEEEEKILTDLENKFASVDEVESIAVQLSHQASHAA